MSIDNKTKTLIVNQVTKEQYKTLVDNSQLIPTELYVIVDDAHYTEQEIITLLMAKQDVLSAGLGVQIVDNTITFDMSNDFYTKEDITELLATKSNVTEAGYTLEYEENYLNLKTIDGEVLSSIIIKSAPDTDGVTISYNDNKELQTIGQITKNNTPKFSWIGTQEEYDRDLEAGIIDEYTECLITDSVGDIISPVVSFDAPTKLSELANDMNFVVQSDLQSVKDELQADIEAGIDDTNLVHKTGNETIEGFKNFKEKIVIENGLNKGRIAHKPVDTSLEDGYIEFGDNTLVYGKQDVQGEVFDEKHDIFHAGNLVAGNNITITKKNGVYKINGQAGGGTGGGSIDNVDNETIIIQDDGSISAQGVLDQNTEDLTAIKFWSGTLEEYNALGEWDDDTIYNVTDDIVETGTEIGANLSLSNLNEEGEARFDAKADKADTLEGYGITNGLNKNQITNCILEVPQRIKYDLTDGTLTIKAGSVVIVPYGVEDLTTQYPKGVKFVNDDFKVYDTQFEDGKFFVWAELVNDIGLYFENSYTGANFLHLSLGSLNGSLFTMRVSLSYSGSTDTLTETDHHGFYNTDKNIMYEYNATTGKYTTIFTLPLLIIYGNGVQLYDRIEQVFNGMGYIGSTIWVDKGVKGLIPNGRNENGTLKNIELVTSKVILGGRELNAKCIPIWLRENSTLAFSAGIYWDEETNTIRNGSDGTLLGVNYAQIGLVDMTSGVVNSMNINSPIYIQNKNTISGLAMPSNKHINLTLGASGTTYKTPANGWIYFVIKGSAGGHGGFDINNNTKGYKQNWIFAPKTDTVYHTRYGIFPVQKGDVVSVTYSSQIGLTAETFRFIYAQGEV